MGIISSLLFPKIFNVIYYELPNDYSIKLCEQIKIVEKERNKPKIGYAYETLLYKNMNIMLFCGLSCTKLKPLLDRFYDNNDGIIIFIDLNEEKEFSLIFKAINQLFENEILKQRNNIYIIQLHNYDDKNISKTSNTKALIDLMQESGYIYDIHIYKDQHNENILEGLDLMNDLLLKKR